MFVSAVGANGIRSGAKSNVVVVTVAVCALFGVKVFGSGNLYGLYFAVFKYESLL